MRPRIAGLAGAALMLLAAGCEDRGAGSSPGEGPTEVTRVVAVSVDGLHPDALAELGKTGAPSLHRLLGEGAGTLNARTARELTLTLPNHTGMMTGRRVGGPSGHGVRFNDDSGGTLEQLTGAYVPGLFDAVHDAGGSTALYTSKEKLEFLARSWDAEHGAPDRVGDDDGRDKIDDVVRAPQPELVTGLVERLATDPTRLTFLHLAGPDVALHESRCMSSAYHEAVRATDRDVGEVLAAVRASPDLRASTYVVLTADHGCQPGSTGHYDQADPDNFRVPFVVWGPGVLSGADLYALNPGRRDPGDARTKYSGPQPVRNLDVAGLVTALLSVSPAPGAGGPWTMPLEVS